MKVGDLRGYPDDTEILIADSTGYPQAPKEWDEAYVTKRAGAYETVVVLTPAEETR